MTGQRSDIRRDKVREARAKIEAGTAQLPFRYDRALDGLIDDLEELFQGNIQDIEEAQVVRDFRRLSKTSMLRKKAA